MDGYSEACSVRPARCTTHLCCEIPCPPNAGVELCSVLDDEARVHFEKADRLTPASICRTMMDVSDVAAEEMSKYAMIKRPGSSQTWQWLVAVAAPRSTSVMEVSLTSSIVD